MCARVWGVKGTIPLLARLTHGLSRRMPLRWRMYLLALRGGTARRHDRWQEPTNFSVPSWSKPLVVVPGAQGHYDPFGVVPHLQQGEWPVAVVWQDHNTWYGRILGTRARGESNKGPSTRWSGRGVLPALAIPKAAAAPLGVVVSLSREDGQVARNLASRLGYLHLPVGGDELQKNPSACLAPVFPKVSVLLPVYNQKRITEFCLRSLYGFTDYPNWEVVAVDNGSTDGAAELLEQWAEKRKNLLLVRNQRNLGFPAACNQAARAATGDILCVLNNDTVVTPGWLSSLVDELLRHPRVGLVGPVSNGVANEARVPAPVQDLEELPLWALARQKRYFRQARKMSVLALFCAATWKTVWDDLGGLDEDFGLGLFEDDDFSFRLREQGLQLRCRLDAYVHHFQGSSFSQMHNQTYLELYERNRKLFWAKLYHRRKLRRPH